MNVWVRIKRTGNVGRIIGWCPDKKGRPRAMVQIGDRVLDFKLAEFRIVRDPSIDKAAA